MKIFKELIVICLFVLYSCNSKKTTFISQQDIIQVPWGYKVYNSHYFSYIVIDKDTIKAKIDTGSNSTFLKKIYGVGDTRIANVTDMRGISKNLLEIFIKKLNWGELTIENLPVGFAPTMRKNYIGNDILKNFCVKFDNENQKITLTSKPNLIEKKGLKIPFEITELRQVIIPLQLNGALGKFLLDTGYDGEFLVDTSFLKTSGLVNSKKLKWVSETAKSAFIKEPLQEKDIYYKILADCTLAEKKFRNVIITHNPNMNENVLGNSFLRRFKSFTIDYLNRTLYLELPEDIETYENNKIVFSKKEIDAVPIEYLDELFQVLNSLGFIFSWSSPPFKIIALEANSNSELVTVGDTLIGINKTIFSKEYLNKFSKKTTYCLEVNKKTQSQLLFKTMHRAKKATFHFAKNGKLISINAVRNHFLTPPPSVGYSFQYERRDVVPYYGKMNFHNDDDKVSFHFPWRSLSNKEIKMIGFDENGNKIHITNNPPK